MPTVKVLDLTNKEVGEIELNDMVFGVPLNEPLIHEAVRSYQANRRQGTSATKTRGDVSGSGRKLWKQKGTGRARIAVCVRRFGKAAATCTDRSRATGRTTCRRKCASARCARRSLNGCAKEI